MRFLLPFMAAIAAVPTLAVAACEDLKARIADGMIAGGLRDFELEIVPIDAVDARTVVGQCEAGSKKIVYRRGGPAVGAAPKPPVAATRPPPSTSEPAARTVDTLSAKPIPKSPPVAPAASKPARSEAASKPFRDSLQQGGEGPLMILLPAGEFVMGSGLSAGIYREGPEHPVTVPAFALGRSEVTFDDYDLYAKANGRRIPDDGGLGRGNRPVVNVSWFEANEYVQWLSAQTGFAYRLPSEAEWEYAVRAGGKRGAPYSTGDCISGLKANFNDALPATFNNCPSSGISVGKAQPVGSYAPNGFGLYDMHGNVFEWTADCVHLGYERAPSDGSAWLQEADGNCTERILRGGSWQSGQVSVRSALRAALGPKEASGLIGFRVARSIPPK